MRSTENETARRSRPGGFFIYPHAARGAALLKPFDGAGQIISLNIQHGYRSAAGNLAVVMLSFGGGNACVRTFCPLALTCAASWYYALWFRLCEYAGAADGW